MKRCMKWLSVFALITAMVSLGACNTLHGAGEDIEVAGEAIQDAAD